KTKDYKQARNELERALARAEKLSLRTLQAQIKDLLGDRLAQSGNNADASSQYAEARRLLDEIAKETQSAEVLKRIDLSSIVDHTTRTNARNWTQENPPSSANEPKRGDCAHSNQLLAHDRYNNWCVVNAILRCKSIRYDDQLEVFTYAKW